MKRFAELAPWILMPLMMPLMVLQAVSLWCVNDMRKQDAASFRAEVSKLQQADVALAAHQSLAACRCQPEGEGEDNCPLCLGAKVLIDGKTGKEVPCDECGGTGKRQKFGAGGRILPTVRSLADEAHQATIESREILRKVDTLLSDIEAGRVGLHVEGSIMKGKHDITLKRQ